MRVSAHWGVFWSVMSCNKQIEWIPMCISGAPGNWWIVYVLRELSYIRSQSRWGKMIHLEDDAAHMVFLCNHYKKKDSCEHSPINRLWNCHFPRLQARQGIEHHSSRPNHVISHSLPFKMWLLGLKHRVNLILESNEICGVIAVCCKLNLPKKLDVKTSEKTTI